MQGFTVSCLRALLPGGPGPNLHVTVFKVEPASCRLFNARRLEAASTFCDGKNNETDSALDFAKDCQYISKNHMLKIHFYHKKLAACLAV